MKLNTFKGIAFASLVLITSIVYLICYTSAFIPKYPIPPNFNESEITNEVYLISYIGDIDGDVNPEWYPLYNRIIDFYEKNNISIGLSFYPDSIRDNEELIISW